MKKELKAVFISVAMALTVSTLVALAENYEWETKLNGIDVELKGNAEQVHNPKFQRECLKMANYAIQQFQANGGVITPKSHEIECQVNADGQISALLERDPECQGPQCQKEAPQSTGVSTFQSMPQPAADISTQH